MTFASLGRKIRQIQVRFVAGLDDGAIWKVDLNAGVDGRGINTRCIGFYIMAASTCIREKCRRGGDRRYDIINTSFRIINYGFNR
jgi:hypothetical protein